MRSAHKTSPAIPEMDLTGSLHRFCPAANEDRLAQAQNPDRKRSGLRLAQDWLRRQGNRPQLARSTGLDARGQERPHIFLSVMFFCAILIGGARPLLVRNLSLSDAIFVDIACLLFY